MDRLMELSEYMVRRIKQMPDKYYLILEPEMVNVCFWYLPTRVRNMPHTQERIKILADVRLNPNSFNSPHFLNSFKNDNIFKPVHFNFQTSQLRISIF